MLDRVCVSNSRKSANGTVNPGLERIRVAVHDPISELGQELPDIDSAFRFPVN